MIEHLIVSTFVLGAALLAARVIPMTAHTRYAVILCGLAKFAIPTAVLRFVPAEAVPQPLRVFGGGSAAARPVVAQQQIDWIPMVWVVVAAILFLRWLLLRKRTIDAALRNPAPPSARELDALRRIATGVELVRSPLCEAPAVLRVIRPVIVLPARGCDELDDDELHALLLHECAHVARRDNLAAIAQALATSVLWFHPLVWLASRALTSAREQACDEKVAEAMRGSESFLSALSKVCRAIVAPHATGASCMAGANIKERLEHLMRYNRIRSKAWPHRAIVIAATIAIALTTVAATESKKTGDRYSFHYTVHRTAPGEATFRITAREGDQHVFTRDLVSSGEGESQLRFSHKHNDELLELSIKTRGTPERGELEFTVTENGAVVQRRTEAYDVTAAATATSSVLASPVSLTLKDATLRDVMTSFSQILGLELVMEPGTDGDITIDVVNVPAEQVLDLIARQNNLTIAVKGNKIYVAKK